MKPPIDVLRRQHNAAIERLQHATGECVGQWRLVGVGEHRSVRCDRCGADYPATLGHRRAASDENYAGIYLRRLAAEGAHELENERGGHA